MSVALGKVALGVKRKKEEQYKSSFVNKKERTVTAVGSALARR
jgi:hypothetical protein